jgi:hypothetical protein
MVLLAPGCSLLLDLPADCVNEDCDGFRCNDEGTGCLSDCDLDVDCVDGFVCDKGQCLATLCVPDGGPVEIFPGEDTRDADLGFNGLDLAAVWKDANGLNFQLFEERGTPKGKRVLLDEDGAAPGRPSMVWTGAQWGVAWEATEADDEGDAAEVLRFAAVDATGVVEVEPKTLWKALEDRTTGRIEKSVDDPSLLWDPLQDRFAVAWSTRVVASDIYLMTFGVDGNGLDGETEISHELGRQLTFTADDSVEPVLVLRGLNVYDVVFREGAGQINLTLRSVSDDGQRQGDDLDISKTSARALSHNYAAITTGSVAVFSEQDGDRSRVFRAQIKSDRSVAGDQKFEIDRGFSSATSATVASAGEGEYAAFFVADRDGVEDIYMARFKDNGARVGAPFSVTGGEFAAGPTAPLVIPSRNGYTILNGERGGETLSLMLWGCSPAP